MSIKEVKRAVKRSNDDFEDGTIVAWTSSERYTYAAIKSPRGWYTTASSAAASYGVQQVITFEALLKIIARSETSNVRVIGLDDGTKVE
jgi:hypothetical protein